MDISLKNWQTAYSILGETPAVDMHLDLPGELLFRHQQGETEVIRKRYLPDWKRAGIRLVGASVYVEDIYLPEAGLRNALMQIQALKEELRKLEGQVLLIRSKADLDRVVSGTLIGIILYLEGMDFLGTDIGLLEMFSELGVSGASLVWSRRNILACGCCRASEVREMRGGITETGRAAIQKMKELHMFLDISHLNDDGIQDAFLEEGIAILATHSNARTVHNHYRNLTDEQIVKLAERGGIIGLNGCSMLAGSHENGRHLEMLCAQSRYLMRQAGPEHVCLGLDLCYSYEMARRELDMNGGQGNDCLAGHKELVFLLAAFLESGMEMEQVKKILGENAIAFLRRILQ